MNYLLKYFNNFVFITLLFILNACQLQVASKNHGILFLENRSKKLVVNTSNKNDVISLIGQPHSTAINNNNEWIYFERVLTKGEFHKLGQNVIKKNNVLILSFDKYGILDNKLFLDKNDKNKIYFSKKETKNELSQKSFVEKFLSSLREKMYSGVK